VLAELALNAESRICQKYASKYSTLPGDFHYRYGIIAARMGNVGLAEKQLGLAAERDEGLRRQAEEQLAACRREGASRLQLRRQQLLRESEDLAERAAHLAGIQYREPTSETKIGEVKFTDTVVPVKIALYDSDWLEQWAAFYFKTAAAEEKGPGIAAAELLLYSRQFEKAVDWLSKQTELGPALRARLGTCYQLTGQTDQAKRTWDEVLALGTPEAMGAVADEWGRVGVKLDEAIASAEKITAELKKRPENRRLSKRRFRNKFKAEMWRIGRLHFQKTEQLAATGGFEAASAPLAKALKIGEAIYGKTHRHSLTAHSPLFLAELARVYYAAGDYEGMLDYMFAENVLPRAYPAAWQIRQYLKELFALRDLDAREVVSEKAKGPTTQPTSPVKAAERPADPGDAAGGSDRDRLPVKAICVAAACVVALVLLPPLLRLRKKRLRKKKRARTG